MDRAIDQVDISQRGPQAGQGGWCGRREQGDRATAPLTRRGADQRQGSRVLGPGFSPQPCTPEPRGGEREEREGEYPRRFGASRDERSPHPLTGGIGDTWEGRNLPSVSIPDLAQCCSRAALLASGFDTVIEAFDIEIGEHVCEWLETARLKAEALSEELTGRQVIDLGGVQFQMVALRGRGLRWRLENDDMTIRIRPVKLGFPVSIRYSAAGLWEHGYPKLREQAESALRVLGTPRKDDWERLSEAHCAFDFFAEGFTAEMRPGLMEQVVAHAEVKRSGVCGRDRETDELWGKAGRLETLTVGKGAPLEIQVYDKGREIEEASGKTWMLDLWEASGLWTRDGNARQKHCWRLEVRFRADFLRNRSIRTMAEFIANTEALLSEALLTRRLCEVSTDSNRARWPMHWLWAAALHSVGAVSFALPLGRKITEAREVLAERLVKALAGTLRSAVVLRRGEWNRAAAGFLLPRLIAVAEEDPAHDNKVALARERYRYVAEAR